MGFDTNELNIDCFLKTFITSIIIFLFYKLKICVDSSANKELCVDSPAFQMSVTEKEQQCNDCLEWRNSERS